MNQVYRITGLSRLRILCRYDAQGLSPEIYAKARQTVFSEPMVDDCYDETMPELGDCTVFAVESLPGQYDQRADSCAQCIGILTCGERPLVSAANHHPGGTPAHQGICHQPRGEPGSQPG